MKRSILMLIAVMTLGATACTSAESDRTPDDVFIPTGGEGIFAQGAGVTQNYQTAVEWFRKEAESGNAVAQSNLGVMYATSKGVTQEYGKAVKWLREAADQDYLPAQRQLSYMYHFGVGVPQNYIQAHAWTNLAASQGDNVAARDLEERANLMTPDQVARAQSLALEWTSQTSKE